MCQRSHSDVNSIDEIMRTILDILTTAIERQPVYNAVLLPAKARVTPRQTWKNGNIEQSSLKYRSILERTGKAKGEND